MLKFYFSGAGQSHQSRAVPRRDRHQMGHGFPQLRAPSPSFLLRFLSPVHPAQARLGNPRAGGASGVAVERPRGALHDVLRDHHLLDTVEARQVEHGVEEECFHD